LTVVPEHEAGKANLQWRGSTEQGREEKEKKKWVTLWEKEQGPPNGKKGLGGVGPNQWNDGPFQKLITEI